MALEERLTTLDALWSVWREHGLAMTDEQWARPTRLGNWDVRSLYAHAAMWPYGFSQLIGQVQDVEPTHATAVALMRDFNRPDGIAKRGSDQIAGQARGIADAYRTAQLVEQFAGTGPTAITTAWDLGPVVIDYFGLAKLCLDEAVSIGIVEATVHLLDLQRALGQDPDVPATGLAHTVALLAGMAPQVDFIEAATGRDKVEVFRS